jgi:hypothetical protein
LGAALNAFSLNEEGPLASTLEKVGQAIDGTYLSTSVMVQFNSLTNSISDSYQLQELESQWAEPLHEYTQFASIIKKLLQYRHQKHAQFEMTQNTIDAKKEKLNELERIEMEARRLETALSNGTKARLRAPTGSTLDESHFNEEVSQDYGTAKASPVPENHDFNNHGDSFGHTPSPDPEPEVGELPPYIPPIQKRKVPGMGLLNAVSYTIHGMMDVNPETARRNNMTKTREDIAQVFIPRAFYCNVLTV